MSRVRIVPYRRGSASAQALAREMGVRRLNVVRTTFRPRPSDILINWGNTSPPIPEVGRWLNPPRVVAAAVNKLTACSIMAAGGVSTPAFTASREEAQQWASSGSRVLARTLLRASEGRGIVVVEPGEEVPPAPLYTLYVKKADEYRVHIVNAQVIDVQQKKRRSGADEQANPAIRNTANGWVFCREGVSPPAGVLESACLAARVFGADFAAVDVGWNRHYGRASVYEVNTAPGLCGTTVHSYARNLERMVVE